MKCTRISVTIEEDLLQKLKDKRIPRAECLRRGAILLLSEPYLQEEGIRFVKETEINKKEKALHTLQREVLSREDEKIKLLEEIECLKKQEKR